MNEKGDSDAYKAQWILLCTWIIELKLNDISKLATAIECKDKDDPTREGNEQALKVEWDDFQ